jgi:class 3 adenylate cyclase
MRVADADRDRTVALLREHVVAGRLTLDEFSDRAGRALEATTRGELDAVMADLPEVSVPTATGTVVTPRARRRWHIAVMSGHDTKGRWRIGDKTNAVAIMGGCDLDLRSAEIEGPEVVITAFAFWGGINVIVPEGFDVELVGFSFMGGRSLKLRDVPIIPGSPRIIVRGFAVMGGIDVKSRSSRSGRKTAKAITESALGVVDALSERSAARSQVRSAPATPTPPSPPPPPGAPPDLAPAASADLAALGHSDLVADGTVTIVFSDMVDYAGSTERLGDQVSLRRLHEHHRIVRDALTRYGGREVKVQGDGFMIAFSGAARAMRCAIDIQRAFREYVPPLGEDPIAVHIGINTGDAVVEGDDYIGHTVIVASRLADAAAPGEILVSSLSEQLVAGTGEFRFGALRETRLKGMTRPQMSVSLLWAD